MFTMCASMKASSVIEVVIRWNAHQASNAMATTALAVVIMAVRGETFFQKGTAGATGVAAEGAVAALGCEEAGCGVGDEVDIRSPIHFDATAAAKAICNLPPLRERREIS
jgi:hypothetical protein